MMRPSANIGGRLIKIRAAQLGLLRRRRCRLRRRRLDRVSELFLALSGLFLRQMMARDTAANGA
jgi:hypothetical protein